MNYQKGMDIYISAYLFLDGWLFIILTIFGLAVSGAFGIPSMVSPLEVLSSLL